MFSLEASWAELPSDERLRKRKERLAPLMMAFFDWCRNQSVLPESKLGSAISYALKYEETFKTVLADGSLVLSNNLAERAIKGLVMGRKNWLFSALCLLLIIYFIIRIYFFIVLLKYFWVSPFPIYFIIGRLPILHFSCASSSQGRYRTNPLQ